MQNAPAQFDLPETGFVRLPLVLRHIPVSKSKWWKGVQDGTFPTPVKLAGRVTAWRAEDIRDLIDELGAPADAGGGNALAVSGSAK